ncbi:kinase-like protein [Mollisia scopiformis]|uniref:Kinase-like protein n=1 Tax=Mollisia scopiformis TaxID=149040 RepID=A0A132BAI5_MOLSC|nr:kinase-like protein [Mollisia scopiformis]KUJ09273.1 kinase-like protein [Mollisia scopiformis]
MFSRTPERNANPLDQPTPRPLYKDATSDLVSRPNREDDFITSTEYSRRPLDYSLSPPSPENDVPELRFSRTSSNDGNDSSDIPRIRVITSSPSPSFHSYDASERGQITSGSFDTAAHVDFSNFSSAGGLLESTTSHDSETSDQSPPTLEDQLWDCRIEWPPQQNTYFVPIDEMKRLVTLSSITMELQRRGTIPDRLNQSDAVEFTQRILATALRLFAILTVIGKSDAILDFLEEGLGDDDLPFVRVDLQFGGSNMSLGSRLRPEIRMKCILRWTRMEISNFLRDQWWMLAPVFKSPGGRVRHYMLDDFFILPYIQDEQHSGRALSGGYSSVWLVKIHPAHQKFYPENHNHVNPPFAIKRLHSTKQEDFKLEVEMLKVFSNGDHPHLIRLLATYEYKGSYFLIFPWAQANLRGYWEANPNMKRTPSSLLWVLRQCRGLSSGLLHIHEYQSTSGPFQDINKQEHLYGRHGDIKPENILFLALDGTSVVPEENYGNLALADFGLTEFHNIKTRTRSLTRGTTTRGTPTYAPPEVALRQKISRAYDIWSLGCVFLELISWVVCGTEGLWQFQEGRGETNSDGFINDDVFYTIIPKPDRHAIVRTSVQEWMRDLHEKPVASQFVHDFVDLISQSMLVVEPAERSRIGPLVGKLQAMIDKAEADPSYLIESVPYPPREVAASNFIGTRPSSPSQKVIFSEG